MGDEHLAEGASSCDPSHGNEWIMKSYEPRICERVNYFVHPDCGKIEGLYLTDSRCQPSPGFPLEKLSTTGSFIELKIDKIIFKMGEMISVSGNSYTTVGLPEEDLGIRVINSEGTKILEFKSKVSPRGDFEFNIQTGNSLSINIEDDYQLHVVNYGKYGSEIFQKITVSNNGLPIPIAPESIPIASTTNNPESSNQIMVQVSEQNPSGINWGMIVTFAVIIPIIVGIIVIWRLYEKSSLKKIRKDPKKRITESDLRNNFSKLSWKDAEDLVGELFKEKGYQVQIGVISASGEQKRTGDFGIDVRAKNSSESIGIQVKHWKDNVKSEDVAKTIGYADPFDKVLIISTKSDFSTHTYDAKNNGQFQKAELWNSEKFKNEIRTHILIEKQ